MTNGTVPETLVDQACLRILTTMFRLGVFNTAYTPSAIPVAAHDAVARQTEEQAITLLKNNNHTLPLSPATKSITVVGADANILASPSGAPWVSPTKTTSVLSGILARAGSASVNWVPGNDPVNAASMLESSDMTTVPSSVLTPTNGVGTGLNAFYWHNTSLPGCPSGHPRRQAGQLRRRVPEHVRLVGGADLAGSDPSGRLARRAAVGRLRRHDHRAQDRRLHP